MDDTCGPNLLTIRRKLFFGEIRDELLGQYVYVAI